jgi:hypothetical protein
MLPGRRTFNLDLADECSELMEEDDFDEVCPFSHQSVCLQCMPLSLPSMRFCLFLSSCKENLTTFTIAKFELLVFVPVGVGRLPELTSRLHFWRRERRWHADIITLQIFSHPSYPSEGKTSCPQRGGYVHTLSGKHTFQKLNNYKQKCP